MDNHISLRSKIFYRLLIWKKLRGQFGKCMETGIDVMGKDKPSKFFLKGIDMSIETFLGRNITVLKKKKKTIAKTVIFIHGGAFVCQSNAYHWDFITDFTRRTGATVYCLDYPLAPKHHSGVALTFIKKYYDYLISAINMDELYIMGDSAGGGLTLSLLIELRNEGIKMPERVILLSPFLDLNCDDGRQSIIELKDPLIELKDIRKIGKAYAGDIQLNDWRVSPLFDHLDHLCPISIYTSDCDTIHPDALRLRDKLRSIEAEHKYYFEPGMVHDWMLFRILPEGVKARKSIAGEVTC